jgi:hypothetical protein
VCPFPLVVDRCRQQVADNPPESDFGHAAASPVIVACGHEELNEGTLERAARGRDECPRHRVARHLFKALGLNEDLNDLCVALNRCFGGNPWSEDHDIAGQNTFRESSVAFGVTYLLPRAQTQADSDRIGCRDPKAAVEVPPSRDHRCRAVGPFQRLDPDWRAKGGDRLLDDLHLILSRTSPFSHERRALCKLMRVLKVRTQRIVLLWANSSVGSDYDVLK